MTEERLADAINEYAAAGPFMRSIQQVRDLLSEEAIALLRSMLDETLP